MKLKHKLICQIGAVLCLASCGSDDALVEPSPVQATWSSLWGYTFNQCGTDCHGPDLRDDTEGGPDMTTISKAYQGMYNIAQNKYSIEINNGCDSALLINPSQPNKSIAAAVIVADVFNNFEVSGCTPGYTNHIQYMAATPVNSTVQDAIVKWIKDGAQYN